ncbi:N-acetylmuramoyl-L-alanine amidase [uncultured Clostridium sp.]|uniref:N-acetylmuramoyl-L-alanine amidase n=1 Tax=uncultured Clostridium sp. TaxID=59620 RepID=UPI00262242D5|nr:N-acetylmuramoyl-L-alanine amidase [uncultured Clostridium sp.]
MVDVILDASHGGEDIGAVGILGTKEKECTLYIARACKNILEAKGVSVKLTREKDEFIEGSERSYIANKNKGKCFVSIHLNTSDDKRECGLEVISSNVSKEVSNLSFNLLKSLSSSSKINSRGTKYSDLILFKETTMPSSMVKLCFMTNPREEKLLLDERFNNEVANLLAEGVIKYLDDKEEKEEETIISTQSNELILENNIVNTDGALTKIQGGEIPEKNQVKQWAKNKNIDEKYIKLVDLYWGLYKERGGINPAIAFAQAIIELNRINLISDGKEIYNNPGGLREDKSEDYKKFDTWKEGLEAHLDHLALYVGAKGYPNKQSKDPRHFSYLFGVCKYVENLSGKWNSDPEYGINILKFYYEILETQTKDIFRESIEGIDGLKTQIGDFKSKVVLMGRTLEEVCKEYNQIYKSLEVLKDEIVSLEVDKKDLEIKNVELIKNVSEQKKVLGEIVKIIGGTIPKK